MSIQYIKSNTSSNIKYIYHLSDIHFKNSLNLLNEYEQIIMKLYDSIESKISGGTEVLVICGNIFAHNEYTDVSINLCRSLIINLTKIIFTIIVIGPNDSIVQSLFEGYPNLCVLESNFEDEYVYNNIKFGSISNKKVTNINGYHNICVDYLPYTMYNQDNVSNDYELILLGGHHEYTFLDSSNSIAYSGNLVQQGHYDNITKHGYIIWPIETTNPPMFVPIMNDYAYITVGYKDKKLSISKTTFSPKYPNILVEYDGCKKTCDTEIIKLFPSATKITFINNSKTNTQPITYNRRQLVHNYLGEGTEEIMEYYDKIVSELKYVEQEKKNIQLEKLYFSNMFGYSDKNYIDFNNKGIIGISGLNTVGKSSIINIILYMLYDKYSDTPSSGKEVMNINKKYFLGSLYFRVNDIRYKIIKYKTEKSKLYCGYYRINNNNEHISVFNKNCYITTTDLLGSFDMLSSLCIINSSDSIMQLNETDRIDFLTKIYGISIFEDVYNYIKDDIAKEKALYKNIQEKTSKYKLDDYETMKNSACDAIKNLENSLSKINIKLLKTYSKLSPSEFSKIISDITDYNNQITNYKGKVIELDQKNKIYSESAKELDKIIKSLENKKSLMVAVSKKGVVLDLLKSTFKNVEVHTNSFLENIADIKVNFNDDVSIVVTDAKGKQISNTSGFQNCVINLALRYSFLQSSLIRTNFMIIDEGGFGTFDKNNIENTRIIFDILREKVSYVLVISHNDNIKKEYNKKIKIYRGKDSNSYIQGYENVDPKILEAELRNLEQLGVPETKIKLFSNSLLPPKKPAIFIKTIY